MHRNFWKTRLLTVAPLLSFAILLIALLGMPSAADAYSQAPGPAIAAKQALRTRVIVFVHGLHGSRESWRAANGAYWPEMLRTDPRFAYSDVEIAEYPTPASNGKMSSVQLADVLWTRLKQDHVWEHHEVVIIAHSLGGILVEEMLLRHPAEAARVKFIVSYGTPHEGSSIARMASIYDKDPLLNDLSDASNNSFLTQLESSWRGHDSVNGIHRFCAYEAEDTAPESGVGRYLRTHARIVSYFSATYGCDVTTPPQEIQADHLHMVRPTDRSSSAYDFFYRVYRDNPVREERVVTRNSMVPGLEAGCDETNTKADFPVTIALDSGLQERATAAVASLVDTGSIRDVNPNPPVVTSVEAGGVAHVHYGFSGPGKKVFVCLGSGHASLKVAFSIHQEVPLREPER